MDNKFVVKSIIINIIVALVITAIAVTVQVCNAPAGVDKAMLGYSTAGICLGGYSIGIFICILVDVICTKISKYRHKNK